MTIDQKERITELLAKIKLGMKHSKIFFETLIDDDVKGTIEINASKILREIEGAEGAVEELREYLMEIDNGRTNLDN